MGEEEIKSRELVTIDQRPVDIVHVKEATDRRDKNIKEFLRPGIDTYELPQKRKDEKPRRALSKAGSERLAYFAPLFGRPAVYADYEMRESNVEPFREWEYTYTFYDKTKKKVTITKTVRGYYRFVFNCKLRVLGTGEVVGNREGECSNVESGRETWTSNTVRQQAQKRSFTQAMLAYHAMSDILTDEEAIEEIAKRSASKGQPKGKPTTPSGEIPAPSASTVSKYGSDESKAKCNFCGKHHTVKGNPIVQHPGPGELEGKWGHADCYAATFGEAEPAEPEQTDDPTRKSLIAEIPLLEATYSAINPDFTIGDREKFFGSRNLNEAKDDELADWWANLNTLIADFKKKTKQ